MFVELGSSPGQWSDLRASEAVAKAAMEAISSFEVSSKNAALGIGGPHYNRQFTEMALKGKVRFGHMIPKYAIPSLTVEVLRQSVEKTVEKIDIAILDWKGIKGADKANVLKALGEIGHKPWRSFKLEGKCDGEERRAVPNQDFCHKNHNRARTQRCQATWRQD